MRRSPLVGFVLLCVACQARESPTQPGDVARLEVVSGVEYAADTRVMESFPVQLATDVTLTNRSNAAVRVTFPDGCVVTLRAYDGDRQVWDQRTLILCSAALVPVDLAPGESRIFTTRTDAGEILSVGLPDGRYRLVAVLQPDGRDVRLDAGTVDLAIPRS